MTYRIKFNGTVPASLNRTLNWNYHRKTKERKMWADAIFVLLGRRAATDLVKRAERKERMRVCITICNSRRYDDDNARGGCKIIFDAIRSKGLIYDDRQEYLDQDVKQEPSSRADRGTIIEIGPAEAA